MSVTEDNSASCRCVQYDKKKFFTKKQLFARIGPSIGLSSAIASEKMAAFREKLALWIRRVKNGNLVHFPFLQGTVTEDASLDPDFA